MPAYSRRCRRTRAVSYTHLDVYKRQGKTPADLPYQTFDNGIVTINTETAEALGLDLAALTAAFKPYCTEITEVTTAENFS